MQSQRLLGSAGLQDVISKMTALIGEHVTLVRTVLVRALGMYPSARTPAVLYDPYRELGVSRQVHALVIKQHYRRLVREIHPDRLRSMGVSGDVLIKAEYALARINHAYDVIARERGLK